MITMPERIAQLREKKSLSQFDLGKTLNLSRQNIEKFETGRQTPSKEQQQTLANFFGVSLAFLRAETNDPTRQDSFLDMILDAHDEPEPRAFEPPKKKTKAELTAQIDEQSNSLFGAMLASKQMQTLIQDMVSKQVEACVSKLIKQEINSSSFEQKIATIVKKQK